MSKSFARNDLRRARPPPPDLTPYTATTYDDYIFLLKLIFLLDDSLAIDDINCIMEE